MPPFSYQSVQDIWEVCRTHGQLLAEAKVFVLCKGGVWAQPQLFSLIRAQFFCI
jgi:hypothetical protein